MMGTDGGPAFPYFVNHEVEGRWHDGMTLRDWFASQALIGGIAGRTKSDTATGWARGAYEIADAMIAERSK